MICPKQSQLPPGRVGRGRPTLDQVEGARVDYAKQSQTWAGWGIWGAGVQGRAYRAKQSQFSADEIPHDSTIPARWRLCETNPIWLAGCRPGDRNMRNEPNWAGRDGAAEAWDARQMCRTKPIGGRPGAGPLRGQPCKTNPISAEADRWNRPIMRNKPNSVGSNVQNEPNLPPPHRGRRD
jgi:hypothetical protein